MAADRFPGLAFAVLFVKILEELGGLFGRHFARLKRLLFRFTAVTVAGIAFGLFRLRLLSGTAIAIGTVSTLAAARLTVLTSGSDFADPGSADLYSGLGFACPDSDPGSGPDYFDLDSDRS